MENIKELYVEFCEIGIIDRIPRCSKTYESFFQNLQKIV